MTQGKVMLVEFISIVGIVVLVVGALTLLSLSGVAGENPVVVGLLDFLKFIGGVLAGLAYAAKGVIGRGGNPPPAGGASA